MIGVFPVSAEPPPGVPQRRGARARRGRPVPAPAAPRPGVPQRGGSLLGRSHPLRRRLVGGLVEAQGGDLRPQLLGGLACLLHTPPGLPQRLLHPGARLQPPCQLLDAALRPLQAVLLLPLLAVLLRVVREAGELFQSRHQPRPPPRPPRLLPRAAPPPPPPLAVPPRVAREPGDPSQPRHQPRPPPRPPRVLRREARHGR